MGSRGKVRPPEVSGGKRIAAPSGGGNSTQTERVILSFENFVCDCVHACQLDHVKLWADLLRMLTSSTWQTVTSAPRQGIGFEKIPTAQLKDEITAGLPPDIDFLSFRCSGAMRMVGFRRQAVLHVRWLDPLHKAYGKA